MKIGILSYPLNNNYGCYLQAYALLTVVQRMGHDVIYIHRRHNKPGFMFRAKYFVKTILQNIKHVQIVNPVYRYEWQYMQKKGGKMIPFFEKHIPHTEAYYTSKELKKHCQSFDAIIVGSDQVWRAELLYHIEDYFLEFLNNPKTLRISYAASFGKKEAGYTNKEIRKCGYLISKFNAISLRERQGLDNIYDFGWNCPKAQVVLDPTLLLKKEDYQRLVSTKQKGKDLFCYILDETDMTEIVIREVSEYLKFKPYNILKGKNQHDYQYESIESWLEYFNSASFVVTDSFHGLVFSIIFNKPFVIIINEDRGAARIETILATFNLTNRVVSSLDQINTVLHSQINWTNVNHILSMKREESISFLLNSLRCNY